MAESQSESPRPTKPLGSLQTITQAKAELEARLAGIHNDLQLTQTIGLLFVKRQEDLKNCFDQLEQVRTLQGDGLANGQDGTNEELPASLREQLALLDKQIHEGQDGILGLRGLVDAQAPAIDSPPMTHSQSGSILAPSALPSSTLPAQTISKPRRHKVVMSQAPSVNDAAFPVQIQEELLNQVRYWTSQAEMKEKLNQEYDTKITEQERIIDALNKQRRLREEGEERQKEDQWNLELLNQELRNQNTELQQQLAKATNENAKIQKVFATATEQVEQLKDKEEKTAARLELAKTRHEQDMVTMRKHMAGIQREKSDLLTKVEELNTTLVQQQQKLSKKATLEAIALAQEQEEREERATSEQDDAPVFIHAPTRIATLDEAGPAAVATTASEPKIASLARETSFAHHQSIISELQTKLSKEITEKEELIVVKDELLTEKEELVKMLADREETIETMRLEGSMIFEPFSVSKKSSLSRVNHGSRFPSESGQHDSDGLLEHPSFDMHVSDEGSQEQDYSNGFDSPMHPGGLFAELAQANSSSSIMAAPETKDQEVMTEPIESWIHTIPGFVRVKAGVAAGGIDVPSSTGISTEPTRAEADPSAPVRAESVTETRLGKPGTQTHQILPLPVPIPAEPTQVISPDVEDLSIAAEPETNTGATSNAAEAALLAVLPLVDVPEGTEAIEANTVATLDKTHQDDPSGPVPRVLKSDAALDEERRHTCDMSQIVTDPLSDAPPVPAIADEVSSERPAHPSIDDREFRVSFGSAFGDKGDSATDTGRIQSIHIDRTPSTEGSKAEVVLGELESQDPMHQGPVKKDASVDSGISSNQADQTVESEVTKSEDKDVVKRSSVLLASEIKPPQVDTAVETTSRPPKRLSTNSQAENRPAALAPALKSHTNGANVAPTSVSRVPRPPHVNPQYQNIVDSSGASVGHPYRPSLNESMSSMSTDFGHDRRRSTESNYDVTSTDPTMIQVITQTMIGDYLWKYTRRTMATMMSEKRHKRYFWIHPYTRTMYWSLQNPAAEGAKEQRAKSALVLAVYQITDDSPSQQPGLSNVSLLIQTTGRQLKLTASSREKHELWFQSLSYLLSRPSTPGAHLPSDNETWSEVQANRGATAPHDTVMILRSEQQQGVRKKTSFNRLQNMFQRATSKEPLGNSPLGTPPRADGGGVVAASTPHVPKGSVKGTAGALGSSPTSPKGTHPGAKPVVHQQRSTGAGHRRQESGSPAQEDSLVMAYPRHRANDPVEGGVKTLNGGKILVNQAKAVEDQQQQCVDGQTSVGGGAENGQLVVLG